MPRKHVHLVDQVHLVAAAGWRILHILQQLTGVLNLGARSGIHFNQVDKTAFIDFFTGTAFPAGCGTDPLLTVQGLGKDACDGGLANTAGTAEQVGMVQAVIIQRVDQCTLHVVLADQLGKIAGAPFTRKNLITH